MAKAVNSGTLGAQRMLKKSQHPKYSDLRIYLNNIHEKYEFEFVIPDTHFVYDLVLFDRNLLIEFDGTSHNNNVANHIDREKDTVAEEYGFLVVHIPVQDNLVIPAETILMTLKEYDKLVLTG